MFSLHMKDIYLNLNFYFMLLLSRSYPNPNLNSNPKFGFLLVFSSKMVEMDEKKLRRTHTRFNSHHDIRICFQYQLFFIVKVNSIQMKLSSFLNCFYSLLPIRILISLLLEDIFLHSKFFSEKPCLVR